MEAEKITELRPEKRSSDRPEDGEFFRFAWRVSEALFKTDFTKVQHRLIHYIIRKTWGWNRKTFIFNLKAAAEEMGVAKPHVSKAYHQLIKADVLKTERGEVALNKYTETWNLEFLKESITEETKRRKATVTDPVTRYGPGNVTDPVTIVTDPVTIITDAVTETASKAAPPDDHSDPYRHTYRQVNRQPPKSPTGGRKRKSEIDPRFLEAMEEYPKRSGGNSITEAWSAFKARVAEGIDPEAMLETIPKYRAWCEAKGRIGTEYVLQASSFFGPKKRGWEGNWSIAPPPGQSHIPHNLPML